MSSTLDKLNKLPKVTDNNQKFFEKLNKILDQNLSKNDNSAEYTCRRQNFF